MTNKEYVLIAAIHYFDIPLKKIIDGVLPKNCDRGLVVTGHRHGQCIWIVGSLTGLRSVENGEDNVGEFEEGFLTSKNRFVGRNEAAKIARDAGQISWTMVDWDKVELYSEDLY